MTSFPCRAPPRASTAGRLNWLPAAQSAIIRLLRHQEAGHVDARPRQIGRPGDPDRDWLASRRVHGSTWNGKQHLWIGQKPEVLEVLREQAIIQSAESSNRIEGVTVAANRLRPLVIGRARPRDRSEEELAGYRAALDWIFSRKNRVAITPDVIRRLHALSQGGSSGDAGEWKKRDNEIVEILPGGERSLRFVPVSAKKTPAAMEMLCRRYRAVGDEERVPPLLMVATFVLDLLCIHPFRDGNGRVSRLATSFLLQSQGFQVAR